MGIAITILVIVLCIAAAAAVIYLRARKIFREDKNYERGLKMVPLLIHLPPLSEDTDAGGRDVRDVLDENISKAQVLYNIISSTVQKNFRAKFYGQRHIGFEIVANKGFVYYYAVVPVSLIPVVEQAVVSAYPSARLEEVPDYNIFSEVGKISGTIGGELTLKENFAYPIATYQDLKRDAMQSLLNALSTLEKEDGAGIQILLRPASSDWRKRAQSLAGKKRKGTDKKKNAGSTAFSWIRQVGTALSKPPEDKKDGGGSSDKSLSGLEQSIVESMEAKTSQPGFEVLIRVVASSNISQRAQAILSNIVATFSLFDAPGKNGFKYTAAKDIESFVTAYILRFFPQEQRRNILNTVELATLFHFPDQKNIPTSQLERQASKQVDGPRNVGDEGLLLGYNVFRGAKKRINISTNDRRRHLYIVGQTGTGKSTMLENLALQDMIAGNGFAFIDPHGDTAERLLEMVPKERTEDVIYFSPADMEYPTGLNLFEFDNPDQKDFLIQEAMNMLYKLYDPQHQGIIGPRYEHLFRNAALTIMADPKGGTFIDIPKLFSDKQYLNDKLKHVTDQTVIDFWTKEMPGSERSNEFGEVKSWFVSKFGAFLSNTMMRNIIGQTKSSFNLRDIMDNKKILLVNLSKGRTGELNSKLLGMVFVMKFQAAAMSRANIPEEERQDFSLYVDEFQNFSTDSFATILSEARKYHLNLIVGNQFTTQLSEEIRDAVFGNVGTIVSFRLGTNDAEFLAKYFAPTFDTEDLQRVPNFNTIVRMLIGGVPSQPFSMATLPPLGNPNKMLGEALKQLSAAKFGRPRAIVEKEIFERISTKEQPKPAFGAQAGAFGQANRPMFGQQQMPPQYGSAPGGTMSQMSAPKAPSSGSSFLDDWLRKRQPDQPASGMPIEPAQQSSQPFSAQPPVQAPSPPPHATPVTQAVHDPQGDASLASTAAKPGVFAPFDPAIPTPQDAAPLAPEALPEIHMSVKEELPLAAPPEATPKAPEKGTETAPDNTQKAPLPHENISSGQSEQNEIDSIAETLRKSLSATDNRAVPAGDILAATVPKTDMPAEVLSQLPPTELPKPPNSPSEPSKPKEAIHKHNEKKKAPEPLKKAEKPLVSSIEELAKLSATGDTPDAAPAPPNSIVIDESGNLHYSDSDG